MDLDTKQTQRLVLSPDMKQSLEILQYTSQDLLLHIQTELEKNPLLEINEDNHTIQQNVESESYPMDWKEYFKSINNDNRGLEDPVYTDDDNNYENMVSTETTLHEYMMF